MSHGIILRREPHTNAPGAYGLDELTTCDSHKLRSVVADGNNRVFAGPTGARRARRSLLLNACICHSAQVIGCAYLRSRNLLLRLAIAVRIAVGPRFRSIQSALVLVHATLRRDGRW